MSAAAPSRPAPHGRSRLVSRRRFHRRTGTDVLAALVAGFLLLGAVGALTDAGPALFLLALLLAALHPLGLLVFVAVLASLCILTGLALFGTWTLGGRLLRATERWRR